MSLCPKHCKLLNVYIVVFFLGTYVKNGDTFPLLSEGWTVNSRRKAVNNGSNHEILLVFTFTQSNKYIRDPSNKYFNVMQLFDKSTKKSNYFYNCYTTDTSTNMNITDQNGVHSFISCNYRHTSWTESDVSSICFTTNYKSTRLRFNSDVVLDGFQILKSLILRL